VGGTVNAKRTALSQVIFRCIGVAVLLVIFRPYKDIVDLMIPGTPDEALTVHIAMGHTVFNITTLILCIPFVSQLTKLVEKIFPDKAGGTVKMPEDLVKLQTSMFSTPSIAIMECEKELLNMSDYVTKNLDMLREMSLKDPVQVAELTDEIAKNEDRIDKYQYQLTQFLIALSVRAISPGDAKIVASRIGLAHNFEKIADCVEHISQIIDKLKRNNTTFSTEAINVINQILDENISHFKKSVTIFKNGEEVPAYADEALVIRIRIKKLIKDAKIQHFNRIKEKICDGSASIQFIDILNNLNTMSAENHNVAEVLAGEKY
ncbi:Na/Pi cotransporter family protein, partial [bacterium]|nr:Na/Pi cotransporter family protein [bacterium]